MKSDQISEGRMKAIATVFKIGGYVSAAEADLFLRLRRGSVKEAATMGKIKFVSRRFGRKVKTMVLASEVETFFGIKK
jgi:hypothetical protein